MKASSTVLRASETAPEVVRRLEMIVSAVAALIARRFLRDPRYMALIVPLWGWLNRTVRRFGRVPMVAAPIVVGVKRERAVAGAVPVARVRLPAGKAWLIKALGWEAVGFGSQLRTLLAEPEMAALLAALPRAQRVLRPLGRMLGVEVGPVVVRVHKPRPPVVQKPRVKKEKPWSPGPIRAPWWPAKRG